MAVLLLRIFLSLEFIWTAFYFIRDSVKNKKQDYKTGAPRIWKNAVIGFVTNFFDTLGIGSFAPTLFFWKTLGGAPKDERNMDRDELLPGTLNIGDCFPVILEALLFMDFVEVEPLTLAGLLVAACLGGWLGAGIVCKWDVNTVRIGLGVCLLFTASVVIMRQFSLGPFREGVGTALGLHGAKLIIGLAINFLLGALMNLGFGLYAPCMGMLMILGMDVGAIFPVMMGSTAIQMPFSSTKFINEGKYDVTATWCLGFFGLVGVVVAYVWVKSMDLTILLYMVIGAQLYTAIRYLTLGIKEMKAKRANA